MLKAVMDRLLGRSPLPKDLTYEAARGALETHARDARRTLAVRTDVEPEILYYLAGDESSEIRKLVAGNPAAPQQANQRLAGDTDADVRCELAVKIARLAPGMGDEETKRVRDLAIGVMEMLANDALPRVRAMLAEEIKSSTKVPPHIVKRLAQDLEIIVAAPILEYSPLLSDEDLLEIIAGARAEGALAAIGRRRLVSGPIADAIVATYDVPGVAALLANGNAQIREETLDRIIDAAEENVPWHLPIVLRPALSLRAVRRIAGFVAASLLEALEQRAGLDAETKTLLRAQMRERLARESVALGKIKEEARAAAAVLDAMSQDKLNEDFVMESIETGARAEVVQALALKAKISPAVVDRILTARSGKAITALVWKAGLSARLALKVQTLIAHVPGVQTILPRNGDEFVLGVEEMNWHLDFFGIKA